MKKLNFIIILGMLANALLAQTNVAPDGTMTDVTGITNPSRINDNNFGTSASIAPYTFGAWFTIQLDDVYNISTVDFSSSGSPSDMYLLFLSETGDEQDFMPYGSAYFDPPNITGINQWAKAVRFMVDNTSASTLYIDELVVLASPPPIKFGYDAAGNRTSRTIEMPMSLKKGTMDEDFLPEEFTDNLEEISFTMYPNPTKGLLTVDIDNFTAGTEASISVFDLQGRQIYHNNNVNSTNEVDLSLQNAGTYILILKVGDRTSEWKIIKE